MPSSFLKVLTQSPFNRPSFQVRYRTELPAHHVSFGSTSHRQAQKQIGSLACIIFCGCAGSFLFSGTVSRCLCASQLGPLYR